MVSFAPQVRERRSDVLAHFFSAIEIRHPQSWQSQIVISNLECGELVYDLLRSRLRMHLLKALKPRDLENSKIRRAFTALSGCQTTSLLGAYSMTDEPFSRLSRTISCLARWSYYELWLDISVEVHDAECVQL